MQADALFAALALPFVLGAGLGHGLPLHVAVVVGTAAGKWAHMVDYVPRAGPARLVGSGAWVQALELSAGRVAAVVLCVCGGMQAEQDSQQNACFGHCRNPAITQSNSRPPAFATNEPMTKYDNTLKKASPALP
jgi:hypothetical protein